MGGGSSSKSAVSSATALGMSAVLGLTPPPPPMAAAEMAKLAGGAAHFQQLMAAAQSSGIDFTMALMPGLLAAGGADPFLNLPGESRVQCMCRTRNLWFPLLHPCSRVSRSPVQRVWSGSHSNHTTAGFLCSPCP